MHLVIEFGENRVNEKKVEQIIYLRMDKLRRANEGKKMNKKIHRNLDNNQKKSLKLAMQYPHYAVFVVEGIGLFGVSRI